MKFSENQIIGYSKPISDALKYKSIIEKKIRLVYVDKFSYETTLRNDNT